MGVAADLVLDPLGRLGVLFQVFLGALPALDAFAVDGKPRSGLVDQLQLDAQVQNLPTLEMPSP